MTLHIKAVNPANIISMLRAVMGFVSAFLLIEVGGSKARDWAAIILLIAVLLDAVDGLVARAFGYESEIGKLSDICADHILANVVWVTLGFLGVVSIWVALITTTRDLVVDFFRQVSAIATGQNGFEQLEVSAYKWVVQSRTMRFLYGAAKLTAWCLLITIPNLSQSIYLKALIWTTVCLCLLRAVPSIAAGWRHVFFAEPT